MFENKYLVVVLVMKFEMKCLHNRRNVVQNECCVMLKLMVARSGFVISVLSLNCSHEIWKRSWVAKKVFNARIDWCREYIKVENIVLSRLAECGNEWLSEIVIRAHLIFWYGSPHVRRPCSPLGTTGHDVSEATFRNHTKTHQIYFSKVNTNNKC